MTKVAKIKGPCPKCNGVGYTHSARCGEDVIDIWAECDGCGAKTDAWETHSGGREYHETVAHDFVAGRFIDEPSPQHPLTEQGDASSQPR